MIAYTPPLAPANLTEGSVIDVPNEPATTPAQYIIRTRQPLCTISSGMPRSICTAKFTTRCNGL